jgi:hypothetical protein
MMALARRRKFANSLQGSDRGAMIGNEYDAGEAEFDID